MPGDDTVRGHAEDQKHRKLWIWGTMKTATEKWRVQGEAVTRAVPKWKRAHGHGQDTAQPLPLIMEQGLRLCRLAPSRPESYPIQTKGTYPGMPG